MNTLTFLFRNIFFKIALALLLPFTLSSQPVAEQAVNLTGVWAGYIKTTEKTLPYEIAVSEVNGTLSGYSYTTFMVKGEEQVAVKSIHLRSEKGNIIIEDDDLLYDNFDEATPRELKQTSTLLLDIKGTEIILTGKFKTKKTTTFRSLSGAIRLRKDTIIGDARLLPKLDQLNLLNSLSFLKPSIKQVDTTAIASVDVPPATTDSSVSEPESTASLEIKRNVYEPKDIPAKTPISVTASKPSIKKVGVAPVPAIVKSIPPIIKPKPTPPVTAAVTAKAKPPVAAVPKPAVKAATKTVAATTVAKAPAQAAAVPVTLPAKPKPVPSNPPATLANIGNRSIETIQTVFFKSDSLLLTLYDNGEVDGDTVSVILNGVVILSKQGLSTTPINKTVYISPDMGDSLQMIMYAENLGSIAPNTGLLIVLDGKDRYYIRFAGDLNKNAAIIFRKKV